MCCSAAAIGVGYAQYACGFAYQLQLASTCRCSRGVKAILALGASPKPGFGPGLALSSIGSAVPVTRPPNRMQLQLIACSAAVVNRVG